MDKVILGSGEPCPSCGKRKVVVMVQEEDIPHFGKSLLFVTRCEACGYKSVETVYRDLRPGARYVMRVERCEDLAARVVRSSTTSIVIPELGVRVDPGTSGEEFIANIEGVLGRVLNAAITATTWLTDRKSKLEAGKVIREIVRAKEGKKPFTLIVEDPLGYGMIISGKAEKRSMGCEHLE